MIKNELNPAVKHNLKQELQQLEFDEIIYENATAIAITGHPTS
jgi:hypothetical protein